MVPKSEDKDWAQTCSKVQPRSGVGLWIVQSKVFLSHCIYIPLGRHYQHPICSALLTVKQGEFPELRIKAWAGRVLIVFLQHKIAELINKLASDPDVEGPNEVLILVNAVLTSICQWFALVEKAGRYLTEEANTIWGTSLEILGISRLKTFLCHSLVGMFLLRILVGAQTYCCELAGFQ